MCLDFINFMNYNNERVQKVPLLIDKLKNDVKLLKDSVRSIIWHLTVWVHLKIGHGATMFWKT